jgi:protein-tyrosine phosphatase
VSPFREPPTQRFEQVANFRDLGGHTTRDGRRVRRGRLYRSGHLAHATERDVETLASLGLRRVFDFRTETDIAFDGHDRLPAGVEHVQLPTPDPAVGDDVRSTIETVIETRGPDALQQLFGAGRAQAMMERSAAGLVRERRRPYAGFLAALAQPDAVPALFHCSAGKDRAGWAASVVLLALGVDEDEVLEQYLLSNRAAEEILERQRGLGREFWSDLLLPLLEVRRSYIEASFEAVRVEWGGFDRYLSEGLGIDDAQHEQLRENLLE